MMPGIAPMMGNYKKPIPAPKTITFAANTLDVNLRAYYNAYIGTALEADDTILFIVNPGVYIGASSTAGWALQPGDWSDLPGTASLNLIVYGRIQGAGGQGGGTNGNGGQPGGSALYMDRSINMVTNGAQIFGGGGGGGNSQLVAGGTQFNGGGGSGYVPGPAGGPGPPGDGWWIMGTDGTTESGGTGFRTVLDPNCKMGDGGGPGESGTTAFSNAPPYYYDFAGGGPGNAVYGWGNILFGDWDGANNKFIYTGAHNADIRGPIA